MHNPPADATACDPHAVRQYLTTWQQHVCDQVLAFEGPGQRFREDLWNRAEGGGGITRVLEHGLAFDRAGVNFSHVQGHTLPPTATLQRPELQGARFEAMGVSLVLHPINPYVPTTHANLRLFMAYPADGPMVWWFGGGFDLTPYYVFPEDAILWHEAAREACQILGPAAYPQFKAQCDAYFYLPHRGETRGIGGLFFDDLRSPDFETAFAYIQGVGAAFIRAYGQIIQRRYTKSFTDRERAFQRYRRGRYVEFNLLYDRGTLFGLQSQGRTESILMSLPPDVRWQYDYHPEPGSAEAELVTYLQPRDWLALD